MPVVASGQTGVVTSAVHSAQHSAEEARGHAPAAAVAGLVARGVLYLLLAFTAFRVVFGHSHAQVDSRGALHEFAGSGAGAVVLVLLALGFLGLAFWNVVDVITAGSGSDEKPGRRLADVARAVAYGVLAVVTVSIAVAGGGSHTDQKSKTWTATVLGWPAGRLLVGAVGVAVIVAGIVLVVRVFLGRPPEQRSIVGATPNDPRPVHVLGVVGNFARGVVVALVGVFVLVAAIQHDPNETVGLDGALKRLLDESFGPALVVAVALGFAAYGVYSLARAWANRSVVPH
jgi:hypothetical protein